MGMKDEENDPLSLSAEYRRHPASLFLLLPLLLCYVSILYPAHCLICSFLCLSVLILPDALTALVVQVKKVQVHLQWQTVQLGNTQKTKGKTLSDRETGENERRAEGEYGIRLRRRSLFIHGKKFVCVCVHRS